MKTIPSRHLADILQEACSKLGLDPSQYGLKYKGKDLDLSLAFRLSGLISGAKLEIVQLSRSPSVVTVGLQLPESEARGTPNGRLVDKFPSTTTLWLVLRKFEAGVAGNGSTRNLTARGVPATSNGESGPGRLFYEMPVVQVMGRTLSTFTDLQKSLAQLGFNSGNILLRLSFRRTEDPLEEAMLKIEDYFKAVGHDILTAQPSAISKTKAPADAPNMVGQPEDPLPDSVSGAPVTSTQSAETLPTSSATPIPEASMAQFPSSRPVTVFSPPTGNTPVSAQVAHNEGDYVPTMDQAQAHQRRLNLHSRPTRLPSDAEIAAKLAAEQERIANIKTVDVKVRFPDQSQVVAKFANQDTGRSLYDFVRTCLAEPFATEKFTLTFSPQFTGPGLGGRKIQTVVSESEKSLLIKDLRMEGRVLVNFSWDASASPAVRGSNAGLLRPELRSQAQELKIEQPPDVPEEPKRSVAGSSDADRGEGRSGARKGGVPKWLKLPGKK